jgi:hypothetical protein
MNPPIASIGRSGIAALASIILAAPVFAQTHIAYDNPAGIPANQAFGGNVGMDFDIGPHSVSILELGAFDSLQDGFATPRTVSIWNRDTASLVTSLTLPAGTSGSLINGSRFLSLGAPVTLNPWGRFSVVLDDVSVDGIRNNGVSPGPLSTLDGAEGAVRFVGGGRFGFGAGTFPGTGDGGPANRYYAGTFKFEFSNTIFNPSIAFDVPSGLVGNQNFGGSLGMDFDVAGSGLTISQIGVFDSGGDGLNLPINAYIYDRSNGSVFAGPFSFSGLAGTLIGSNRFLDIADIALPAGFQGSVVAEGYGPGEFLYNSGGGLVGASITSDGGGLFSFTGSGRFGTAGAFPGTPDGGPANRYAAGTFMFVPEPVSAVMLLAGGAMLASARRRRMAA